MTVRFVCPVILLFLNGAWSEVCETGSEESSVLQVARTSSHPRGEARAAGQALIENAALADNLNETVEELLSKADTVIVDPDMDTLEKSLAIATDLAGTLHLPKTSGVIMPRVHKEQSGPGHKVDAKKFDHEKDVITELLATADNDTASVTKELSEELSTVLEICDGGASGKDELWSQTLCSIRCGAAGAVAGTACGISDDCSASVQEASTVCAACPDQICTSSWFQSTDLASNLCKSTHEGSMLALSSATADESEWGAEKDVLQKIYRSPTMDPLSRSVLLEEQLVEMLYTCEGGAEHSGATSLAQLDAGAEFFGGGMWQKVVCAAGCGAAVLTAAPACAVGVVTAGITCVVPLLASVAACGACPDVMCLSPHIYATVYTACVAAGDHDYVRPICDFCSDWMPGLSG